jgi:hypothetical protein
MRLTVDVVKEGEFRCDWQFTPDKCGLNADLPNTRSFRYEVRVRAKHLDAQGFGMDNREIARYFAEHFRDETKVFVSCERMALDAAKHFHNRLEDGGQGCEYANVKIWGFPGAFVDVTVLGESAEFVADSATGSFRPATR